MDSIKEKSNSYLSFSLGEEIFAAHVSKVLNILEMTKITKVPQVPNFMKGVINLRGAVLPVVDTRLKFGLEEIEYTNNTCIIVLELYNGSQIVHIGAIVDAVQEVLDIGENQIQPPPSIGSKYKSEFIQGMGNVNEDEFIMILDIDKIFSMEEVIFLAETNTQTENVSE